MNMHIDIHKMYVTTGSDSRPLQYITNQTVTMNYKLQHINVSQIATFQCLKNHQNINCHISMYYKLQHANEQNKSPWQHITIDNVNYHSFPH